MAKVDDIQVTCPACGESLTAEVFVTGVHGGRKRAYVTVHITGLRGCPHVENPRGPDEGEPIAPGSAAALGVTDFFEESP